MLVVFAILVLQGMLGCGGPNVLDPGTLSKTKETTLPKPEPTSDATVVDTTPPQHVDVSEAITEPTPEPSDAISQTPEPDQSEPTPAADEPPRLVKKPKDIEGCYPNKEVVLKYKVVSASPVSYALRRGGSKGITVDTEGAIKFTATDALVGQGIGVTVEISNAKYSVQHSFTLKVFNALRNMVKQGTYYIDTYESVVSGDPDCATSKEFYGQNADDYPTGFPNSVGYGTDEETQPLYACSLPNVLPSRFISWLQAKRACENVGKRLCTRLELQDVCGQGLDGTQCNWNKKTTVPTGSMANCKTASGVFDITGNLHEWTSELQCEPVDSIQNYCAEQCLFSKDQTWCNTAANLQSLRTEKAHGGGYVLFGAYYNENGEWYARCDWLNPRDAREDAEGSGLRCCR